MLGFLKWNPYVRIFSSKRAIKSDSKSLGGPFPSTVRPGLRSFAGVPLRCPPDYSNQERGHYTDEEQEYLHHFLVHLHLGPLSRLHVRA